MYTPLNYLSSPELLLLIQDELILVKLRRFNKEEEEKDKLAVGKC